MRKEDIGNYIIAGIITAGFVLFFVIAPLTAVLGGAKW